VAQITPKDRTERLTREEAVAKLRRLRAELADANPDLTDEDWDDFASRWAADVNAGLADRVRERRRQAD